MRVWLITVGEPLPVPGDMSPRLMRTGALARRLVARGHDVTWWTSTFDHYRKRHHRPTDSTISWDGGTIKMIKSVGYRRNVSLTRIVEHAGVARKFRRQAHDQAPPAIILVSLPTIELAREAVRFGRTHGVPVLVDVRDLWPDVLMELVPGPFQRLGRLAFKKMERDALAALKACAGIVGISDGYLEWALRRARRARTSCDAVFPLGYVPSHTSESALRAAGDRLRAIGVDSSKKLCWYVGSFGRHYDLAPVLRAALHLYQSGRTDLQFVISGEGEQAERWRQMAAGAGNVVFTGWIGADEINWLRSRAAIGLQPYIDNAPQGLANKLFEYLSGGVPVVSSLKGENEALIEAHRCGLTYRAGDAFDCLKKLRAVVDDDGLRRAMSARGKELFARRFDGTVVLDGLAAHLERVADREPCSRRV